MTDTPSGARAASRKRAEIRIDRAAGEFRRGRAVAFIAGGEAAIARPVEGLAEDDFAAFAAQRPLFLALTLRRATLLHVRTAVTDPTLIQLPPDFDAATVRALADPTADLDFPLRGPLLGNRDAVPHPVEAAVQLCKRAELLPAALVHPLTPEAAQGRAAADDLLVLDAAAIGMLPENPSDLTLVTSARLPIKETEAARLYAFRPADGGREHLAIVVGDPPRGAPVLVRLHSECLTGDVLGSLRCDCGEQLRGALQAIAAAGGGVLLYLAQEGRGIGLVNKLRAYRLQDQGFDTVDANLRLGFEADERLFVAAAAMLRRLGFLKVRLLTNNPAKVEGLIKLGIEVAERVPHAFPANPHNAHYLEAKRKRSGHYL